ncbi:hypothetical protein GW17_00029058 [Ensete ventricosum]|nr:hypothetical protein GW17_00029058 [Ensete ventricosum]RZR82094.1 hypothetical protein BHM03_00008450 [Ensete ventricosum]
MGLRWWAVALTLASWWCIPAEGGGGGRDEAERERGRSLLGFTEAKGNASYQCSPSGACLPCQHSEKVIMVGLLLISGPVVYLRLRRISLSGTGFMKIPATVPRL